jgi:hypothetical protein
MADEEGFEQTPAQKRNQRNNEKLAERQKAKDDKNETKNEEEMDETEDDLCCTTRFSEKVRISIKYQSNYTQEKGAMIYEGIPILFDTFFMMFEIAPTIHIRSTRSNHGFHRTAPFPSKEVAQTLFHAEEYPRKDGSGRTDYIVILESVAGITVKNIKQNQEFQEYLRSHNIHIFAHRHESFRVSTIGHLFNKLPDATNMDELRDYLEQEMAILRGITVGDSAMNKIELSLNRVIHFAEDDTGKTFRGDTLAIQVVCATAHVKLTRRLLQSGIASNSQTGKFVPRSLANSSPNEYLMVLADHENFRNQHSILRVHNIPEEVSSWPIMDPNDGQQKQFSEGMWAIKDEEKLLTKSIDKAVYSPGDWLVVFQNQKINFAKHKILDLVEAVKQTDEFAANPIDGGEWEVTFSHREDIRNQQRQYIAGITNAIDRTTILLDNVFQAVEKKPQHRASSKPQSVLKPSSYPPSDPSKSGVTWAEMVKPGRPPTPAVNNATDRNIPLGNPTNAFERSKATGFGRGGGTRPSPDLDTVSVFSDEEMSYETTTSKVDERILALIKENEEQRNIIKSQDEKIDKLQSNYEKQITILRQEQEKMLQKAASDHAALLTQVRQEHQAQLAQLSAQQEANTDRLTISMRATMKERMQAQMSTLIAELGRAQVSTPSTVELTTLTNASTLTPAPPNHTDMTIEPATIYSPASESSSNGQFNDVLQNPGKRPMLSTPDVSPEKGQGSIVPLRKLPVPPS